MDGMISSDVIGAGDNTMYGADYAPAGPVQDMYAIDPIVANNGTDQNRTMQPSNFTGGTGGGGLGGEAEGLAPGGVGPGNTLHERRGF